MTYNFWLEGREIDAKTLSEKGFEQSDGTYSRQIDLVNGIYVKVKVVVSSNGAPQLFVDVFDGILNIKCAQFYNGHGGAALKNEVREKVLAALF